jgi:hypothetical protein
LKGKVAFRTGVLALLGSFSLMLAPAAAPKAGEIAPPPGYNVHLVREAKGRRFWRGAAPRRDTLEALAASARQRGVPVTLVDLRRPATADDVSGKQSKLSPAGEADAARELGLGYLSLSALDREFATKLWKAVAKGDVYMHCMYGVNRTGFAVARYAYTTGETVDRTGLGPRDWKQGNAFQARLGGRSTAAPKAPEAAKPSPSQPQPPAPDPNTDKPGELTPAAPQ